MLLYRLGGSRTHLLGAAHRLPPDVAKLPARLRELHSEAREVAFEWDPFDSGPPESTQLPTGVHLRSLLRRDVYDAAAAAWTAYAFQAEMGRFPVWLVAMALMDGVMRPHGYVNGQDKQLWLDTPPERRTVLDDEHASHNFQRVSADDQLVQLRLALDPQRQRARIEKITRATVADRDTGLAALNEVHEETQRMAPSFVGHMLDSRNAVWLKKITNIARRDTPALVLVGGLHLVGRCGLLPLLDSVGLTPQPA